MGIQGEGWGGSIAFQNKVKDKRLRLIGSSLQTALVLIQGSLCREGLASWKTYLGSKGKSSLQQGETTGHTSFQTPHGPLF